MLRSMLALGSQRNLSLGGVHRGGENCAIVHKCLCVYMI